MYGYIYKTTNLINNKIYVGQHKWNKNTLDESYLGSGILLNEAIQKYGIENFSCTILEICETRAELNEAEKVWIKKLDATNHKNGYNIALGGEGSGVYGKRNWTEEGLNNIRKANSHPHTKEHNEKIRIETSKALKGKSHTAEWHKKIIESKKANGTLSGWHRKQKSNKPAWNKGLTAETDERVAKYAKSNIGRDNSGTKNGFYGKKHTDIAKERNRQAHLGMPAHNIGKKCVNDGIHNLYINKEEIEKYLALGYNLGCKKSNKEVNG